MNLIQSRVLLVHLGALGAVVRSTALLKLIHQKHPNAHLTWVTQKPAHELLQSNDLIDRILTTETQDLLKLRALRFDVAYVIDKSLEASGVLAHTAVKKIYGLTADALTGAILPATPAANELWDIGLNDDLKFHKNKKTELALTQQSLELPRMDANAGYYLPLNPMEKEKMKLRRAQWGEQGRKKILGINTGCSAVLPAKKMTVELHRELIQKILFSTDVQIVLLGGKEDRERNKMIAQGLPVLSSETDLGLRDGLISVAACDFVFTGDSLGMHMAISQKVYTLAWFGPSCAHEIDFFGHGEAILTRASCSPCWKRSCQKSTMCYDLVELNDIVFRLKRRLSCPIQRPNETIIDLS